MDLWYDIETPVGALRIEARQINPDRAGRSWVVFLHEGLGSVALWRDFPQRLCNHLDCRGLVYSRPGYGRSTPRPAHERWTPAFMHDHARWVLPAVLDAAGLDRPPWLFGHSDGGSIALLHAAIHPGAQAGLIVLAPHIFVEACSIESIQKAREDYEHGVLRERLSRFHDDVDSAFYGWNDAWLAPAFAHWSIDAELARIQVPVMAVMGQDDEYGTAAQIEGIAQRLPGTELHILAACGHSPHRDQAERVLELTRAFIECSA